MIGGKILAAEFPKSGVEITDIDHIAGGVFDLDPVADAVRLPDKNIIQATKLFIGVCTARPTTSEPTPKAVSGPHTS